MPPLWDRTVSPPYGAVKAMSYRRAAHFQRRLEEGKRNSALTVSLLRAAEGPSPLIGRAGFFCSPEKVALPETDPLPTGGVRWGATLAVGCSIRYDVASGFGPSEVDGKIGSATLQSLS